MYQFIYSPATRHCACFQVLEIMNKTSLNIKKKSKTYPSQLGPIEPHEMYIPDSGEKYNLCRGKIYLVS